jgi:hypothetical protein
MNQKENEDTHTSLLQGEWNHYLVLIQSMIMSSFEQPSLLNVLLLSMFVTPYMCELGHQ